MRKLFYIILPIILVILILGFHSNKKSQQAVKLSLNYIALGDSVSAGDGLMNESDSSACNRTNQSFPNLVAQNLNLNLVNNSCSGATFEKGILGKQDVNKLLVDPQIQQLFGHNKPYLITLTSGANDIGWTDFITKCYTSFCGTDADSNAVDQNLSTLTSNLSSTLNQIKSHYGNSAPKVIVTGYYQIFPTSSSPCQDLNGINNDELTWLREQQVKLNASISSTVSQFSFAKFASIDFTGHELCTSNSWVQGLGGNAPFHPNASGQSEYSKQVISAVKQQ